MLETPTSIIFYPSIPMARFGLTPFQENKYRIIWAPSRMITLTGAEKTITVAMYVNTIRGLHVYPAIEPVGEHWILEGWKSAEGMTRLTKEQWEADPMMLNMGPFPARGDYVRHETLNVNPSDANIEKLITWIEAGAKRDYSDNVRFCEEALEADIADRKSKRDALMRNAMRPWGAESYAAAGGGRNSKTYPILKSREELGLPGEGVTKAMRPRRPATYEVPQAAE
jgi:hypothetical protein